MEDLITKPFSISIFRIVSKENIDFYLRKRKAMQLPCYMETLYTFNDFCCIYIVFNRSNIARLMQLKLITYSCQLLILLVLKYKQYDELRKEGEKRVSSSPSPYPPLLPHESTVHCSHGEPKDSKNSIKNKIR